MFCHSLYYCYICTAPYCPTTMTFVFAFIVVPTKWVRVAREWTLNIYTKDRWLHYQTVFNASYG